MSGLLMLGCGGPIVVASGILIDPTYVFNNTATTGTNLVTFTTTADVAAGDVLHIVCWGQRAATSVSDGLGNTYDIGTSGTQSSVLTDAMTVATNAIPSGTVITINFAGAVATNHVAAVKYPSGGAQDIEGTPATSGSNVTSSSINISARNSSPQYIGLFIGLSATASTANTPSGFTKLGQTATGLGIVYYWQRVTDALAINGVTITHNSTQTVLNYRTMVSD